MHFTGTVQKNLGEGARMGFPTANITLNDTSFSGIFAGEVIRKGNIYPAAVYADRRRGLLEAHILDFEGDLYGQEIEIRLRKKIREDASFTDEEHLKLAIAADVQAVRDYFKTL